MWQKSFGGNSYDRFSQIKKINESEFVVIGSTRSTDIDGISGSSDGRAILLKYNKNGDLLWIKSWGNDSFDTFDSVLLLNDKNILVTGSFSWLSNIDGLESNGATEIAMIKYDQNGNILWQKSWGGEWNERAVDSIAVDDGYILVGNSSSNEIFGNKNESSEDAIILKFNNDGNLVWQQAFGGKGDDSFNYILCENDGYVVYGYGNSYGIDDINSKKNDIALIAKYDLNGKMIWKNYYDEGEYFQEYNSAVSVSNGVITTLDMYDYTDYKAYTNNENAILIKYDKNGKFLWKTEIAGNMTDIFNKVFFLNNSELLVFGFTQSQDIDNIEYKGSDDVIIAKYLIKYNFEQSSSVNGVFNTKQKGDKGLIEPTPNEGYEVDTIIVKDINGNTLDIEITKLEDGTYSFPLYTDVSIEVLFKEKLVNPKTGIVSYIGEILAILFISISTFCVLVFNKKSYRL